MYDANTNYPTGERDRYIHKKYLLLINKNCDKGVETTLVSISILLLRRKQG